MEATHPSVVVGHALPQKDSKNRSSENRHSSEIGFGNGWLQQRVEAQNKHLDFYD